MCKQGYCAGGMEMLHATHAINMASNDTRHVHSNPWKFSSTCFYMGIVKCTWALIPTNRTNSHSCIITKIWVKVRHSKWTRSWVLQKSKELILCIQTIFMHFNTFCFLVWFALTNLQNSRTVGICEALRTFTRVEVIIQPRQTDASIFTRVWFTYIPCKWKEGYLSVFGIYKPYNQANNVANFGQQQVIIFLF